jgi:carotenoid cleavage dioxygenase-like enzyme
VAQHQLIRLDLNTCKKSIYYAGEDTILSEPIFIPLNKNSKEGEGYLVCLASSFAEDKTELLFFDSECLMKPFAKAKLSQHFPFGFHGIWIPEITIDKI